MGQGLMVVLGRQILQGEDPGTEVFGTPAYASPEQLDGGAKKLDVRTDVYSLGVLLYEMLTGRSPYGRWDSVPELLRRVGSMRPAALSTHDARLGDAMDAIVRTAMQRDPEARYAGVPALASDVRRYLHGEPVRATD